MRVGRWVGRHLWFYSCCARIFSPAALPAREWIKLSPPVNSYPSFTSWFQLSVMSLWFHLKCWVISHLCERSSSHAVSVVNWWWRERKQLMSLCMHEYIPLYSCGNGGFFLWGQLKDWKTQSEWGKQWQVERKKMHTNNKQWDIQYELRMRIRRFYTLRRRRGRGRKGTLLKVSCDCVVYSCNPLSFLPQLSSGTLVSLPGAQGLCGDGKWKSFFVFLHFLYVCECVFVAAFVFVVVICVIVFVYVCFAMFKYLCVFIYIHVWWCVGMFPRPCMLYTVQPEYSDWKWFPFFRFVFLYLSCWRI